MLFDTDIFIWIQRGNLKAARLVERDRDPSLSVQRYMELLHCARNKRQLEYTRSFLRDFAFRMLPLTENIGHRAAIYIEQYSLSNGMRAGDALVAATAAENNLVLCTENAKHFTSVEGLKIKAIQQNLWVKT